MRAAFAASARAALALATSAMVAGAAHALDPSTLGLVINTRDPESVVVGEYYAQRRAIPERNIVRLDFAAGSAQLSPEEFARVREAVETRMPGAVQALALAWTAPFRVGCMSVTAAFALGYDATQCTDTCRPTRRSVYFDSDSTLPYTELGLRPATLLAGSSVAAAKRTIDRGIAAETTPLKGAAYLLRTDDKARNVRAAGYPATLRLIRPGFHVALRDANALYDAQDVVFYFTGRTVVEGLNTLRFRPGAIADHLTSAGGFLRDSPQMSSLAWLDAGATASFGTVVEPCAFPQKFPQPAIVMRRYLDGETLIEAYWKSVAMPDQGVFIGEPLARISPR